jgi:hypothetical protein
MNVRQVLVCFSVMNIATRPIAFRLDSSWSRVLMLTCGLALGACDKAPLTAPTDSAVSLFTSNAVVALNGSIEITASVTEPGGVPVQNGTQVSFTTTLGSLEPAEARTSSGRATVRLNAGGASGIAQVRAFSGGAQAEALEIRVGAAAATSLTLTPQPGALGPNGGAVELLAVVVGENNRRLPGVPVTFGSTAGTVRDSTVVSDANGEARTVLTTTREATVTAAVGALQQTATIRVTARPSVTLTTPATAVGVGEAVGITVNVQPTANGDSVRDVVIDFGDGTRQSLGPVNGSRPVQKVYARAGTYTISVFVTDSSGETTPQSTTITVEERSVPVTLTANPLNPAVGTSVTFTATATSSNILRYEWDFGDGTTRVTTGPTVNHVFGASGRRTVTLRVVNAAGQVGQQVLEIVVQ